MKYIYNFILISSLFISPAIFGFGGMGTIGGRSAGMGRASVSLSDFWSIQNNPAGMALQRQMGAGLAYENKFLMKELSLKSAAVIVPVQFGVLGASFNQFGYNKYNENKLGIAYARAFGPALRIGLQLDYLSTRIVEGYEGMNNLTFELGVQSDINSKMTVGAYIFNPIRAKLSKISDERIPVVLRFGLSYKFTDKLIGIGEIEKQFDFDPDLRLGLEYTLTETFYLRTGVAVNPGLFTMGAGLHLMHFTFDVAASMHQVLGTTAQASIIYQFGKIAK